MTKPKREHLLAAPFFQMALKPVVPVVRPLLDYLFRIRWYLSRPFEVKVVPKWMPPIPGLTSVYFVSFGQILLALPLLLLIGLGYQNSFVSPGLDKSGKTAGYALLAAFLTANKSNSLVSLLFGIPFERLIPFHNLSALVAIVLSGFHTYVVYVHGGDDSKDEEDSLSAPSDDRRHLSEDSEHAKNGSDPDFIKFLFDGGTNLSGSLIILCMLILYSSSIFPILRRWFFEFWLITHVLSALGVILFCAIHSVSEIWIVAAWWAVDVVVRYVVMANCRYPTKSSLKLVLPDVVEVRFRRSPEMQYNPGQFLQVCFPTLSPLEFHPITISSAPHEEDITLHIKAMGSPKSWTRKLISLASAQRETSIRIEGPYGSVAVDLDDEDRYQIILMVGGGIGVTPCQSLAKTILYQYENGRKLQKLHFAWAVRDLSIATTYPPPILSRMEAKTEETDILTTDIYVTRPAKSDEESSGIAAADTPFNIISGRPNFALIFEELKEQAIKSRQSHVAVVVCGPTEMMDEVRLACRRYSDNAIDCKGVKFDLHEELFHF